jgi:hypothetical protein
MIHDEARAAMGHYGQPKLFYTAEQRTALHQDAFIDLPAALAELERAWTLIDKLIKGGGYHWDEARAYLQSVNFQAACQHKNVRWAVNPDEPHMGASVEICNDCGMSRSHWEQGDSGWMMVDVTDFQAAGANGLVVPTPAANPPNPIRPADYESALMRGPLSPEPAPAQTRKL